MHPRDSAIVLVLAILHPSRSQVAVDPLTGVVTPNFLFERNSLYEELAKPRYSAGAMDYVDGATSAVLRNPYTILHTALDELYVASFTLNHVVHLRWMTGKRAQYKVRTRTSTTEWRCLAAAQLTILVNSQVFISGKDLDGPVGMALHGGAL